MPLWPCLWNFQGLPKSRALASPALSYLISPEYVVSLLRDTPAWGRRGRVTGSPFMNNAIIARALGGEGGVLGTRS